MTKLRAPASEEQALSRIAGVLTWPGMARILGMSERTVRNWGEPDTSAGIPYRHAIALDIAYRNEGGQGAPLFECYALRLDMAQADPDRDPAALARAAMSAAKEGGEAVAALIEASMPGAGEAERLIARREIEQGIQALTGALPLLEQPTSNNGPGVPPLSPS